MAPHSSTLAWKIPWMEEPGRLQSMGSLRVGHDWATSLSLFTFMHWGRKWQPALVFLPGESQGRGSLVGCRLWGCTESDTTNATWQQQQQQSKMKEGLPWRSVDRASRFSCRGTASILDWVTKAPACHMAWPKCFLKHKKFKIRIGSSLNHYQNVSSVHEGTVSPLFP